MMERRTIMHSPKTHIVIGICTRQRNALLRRLINSISVQESPAGYSVEIVIIDNNDQPMSSSALAGLPNKFPITHIHEAKIGLAHARNRALDEAAARSAGWFIGVDDDEWVATDWLAKFVASFETTAHPIQIAPCRYVYDHALSVFLEPVQLRCPSRGERPIVMATSNFSINRCVFDAAYGPGLRFDPTFNESGGEDLEFFLRAERLYGWVPASLPGAVAFENWDGVRATLSYRLSRSLRNQISANQVAQRHRAQGFFGSRPRNFFKTILQLNRHIIYGTAGLLAGVILLAVQPRKGRYMIGRGLERGARALAFFYFLIGLRPVAYGASIQVQ